MPTALSNYIYDIVGNVFSNMWRVEFFVKLRINKRRAKPVGDDDKRGLENKYAVGILHTGTGSGMQ